MKVKIENMGYDSLIADLSGVELQALQACMNKFVRCQSRFRDDKSFFERKGQFKFQCEVIPDDIEIRDPEPDIASGN